MRVPTGTDGVSAFCVSAIPATNAVKSIAAKTRARPRCIVNTSEGFRLSPLPLTANRFVRLQF
jgi:hypothetical protein